MKKGGLVLLILLLFVFPLVVLSEEMTTAVTSDANWTTVVTQVVIWVIGGLFGLLTFALKKWLIPWFRNTIIPWMRDRHLLSVATEAVRFAETQLGRYTGEQKWDLARDMLDKLGWDVDSTAVIAALKSAWLTLDIEQIAAGIKDAAKDAAAS